MFNRKAIVLIGAVAGILLLILLGLAILVLRSGVRVTIQNSGSQPLGSVVLHVTGASYPLGDIAPGSTAEAIVRPTGESHLEIDFTVSDGTTHRLDAGGYFESGYRGTIDISIKDGVIDRNDQDISLPYTF